MTYGCVITTPSFYAAPSKVEGEPRKALALTRSMGADALMVVLGATGAGKKVCSKTNRKEMLTRSAELFTLAVKLGRKAGIQIGFENTPVSYKPLAAAADCRELLNRVPGLGFIFDTGNFRIADTCCDESASYELLKDRIIRVHVKDVSAGSLASGEECSDGQKILAVTTGSGVIPVEALLHRMWEDG